LELHHGRRESVGLEEERSVLGLERVVDEHDRVLDLRLVHEVVLDEVLVDEAAEQRALVPTNDQMVDVQVTKVLQVVRYQIRANFVSIKAD